MLHIRVRVSAFSRTSAEYGDVDPPRRGGGVFLPAPIVGSLHTPRKGSVGKTARLPWTDRAEALSPTPPHKMWHHHRRPWRGGGDPLQGLRPVRRIETRHGLATQPDLCYLYDSLFLFPGSESGGGEKLSLTVSLLPDSTSSLQATVS